MQTIDNFLCLGNWNKKETIQETTSIFPNISERVQNDLKSAKPKSKLSIIPKKWV